MAKLANADGQGQGLIFINTTSNSSQSNVSGSDAIAIGSNTTVTGIDTMAIGRNSIATQDQSIVIGRDARNSQSLSPNCVVIGNQAGLTNSPNNDSVLVGYNTSGNGASLVLIGSGATSGNGSNNAVVIGQGSTILGAGGYNVVVGTGISNASPSVIALGAGVTATTKGAIAIGRIASVSTGLTGIAIGYIATTTGASAIAIAGDVTTGISTTASGDNSVAIGKFAKATRAGQFAYSSDFFAAQEDAQIWMMILRNTTTTATVTEILAGGLAASYLTLADNHVYSLDVQIVGRRTDVVGDTAVFSLVFAVKRETGVATVALLGTPTKTVIQRTDATWDVNAAADTTNGRVAINVTGAAAKTIHWMANARVTEVA